MNLVNIKDILMQTLALVEDAEKGELSSLERDLILQNLRRAYEVVRFGEEVTAVPQRVERVPVNEPNEDAVASDDEEAEDGPEIEIELIMPEESEVEVAEPEPTSPAETPQPALEDQTESVAEEQAATPSTTVDNSDCELTILRPSRGSAINALYGEAELKPEEDKPAAAAVSLGEEERVIGEIFRRDTPSVGDSIVRPKGVAEAAPLNTLKQAIGVADRFMMIRDLFGGDGEAFDRAIEQLDTMPSLDEALICIAENYVWNPNSEGAKMLMHLLQRKYQA